jgi:ATP-dependent HslUV protease ATP-binding subunit HslU
MGINKELTPKKIVEELNKYIISQDEAKKAIDSLILKKVKRK